MITEIVLNELVHGLNGNDGLMREHMRIAKVMAKKQRYQVLIMEQTRNRHKGKVEITYIRLTTRLMDWDNHCASFKHLGDALVKAGVITDDKPSVVISFIPVQRKVKTRKQHRTIIRIEDA